MIDISRSSAKVLQEPMTKPPKKVVRTLVAFSKASDFEGARAEWELLGNVDVESKEFIENCELCGAKLYKTNWLIFNPNTECRLVIGSECIKRFIQFAGTASQADSNQYFNQVEKDLKIINELNTAFKDVVLDSVPLARQVNSFRSKLVKVLESRGYYPMSYKVTSPEFLFIMRTIFRREKFTDTMLKKLWAIIFEPESVVVQRENKAYRDFKNFKEGKTWQRKNRVTHTTLSRSSAFQTDFKFSESKWERTSSDEKIEERNKKR